MDIIYELEQSCIALEKAQLWNTEINKKIQKRLKKRKQGSKRYNKLKKQIAKLHEKIANKREYFAHKTSKQLVNNHDTLIFEDLNIVGMAATFVRCCYNL